MTVTGSAACGPVAALVLRAVVPAPVVVAVAQVPRGAGIDRLAAAGAANAASGYAWFPLGSESVVLSVVPSGLA